jgi:hypothetical protein
MMKNFGIVRLATNSFEEIQEWTRFLLSPPTTNRRTTTVNGFLWIGTSLPLSLSLRCRRHGWIRAIITCGPYATAQDSFFLPSAFSALFSTCRKGQRKQLGAFLLCFGRL